MAGRFVVDDTILSSTIHAVVGGQRCREPGIPIHLADDEKKTGSLAETCWSAGGVFYTAFCSLDRRPQSATGGRGGGGESSAIDSQPRPTGSIWNIKTTKGLVWLLRVAWVYPTECGLRGGRHDREEDGDARTWSLGREARSFYQLMNPTPCAIYCRQLLAELFSAVLLRRALRCQDVGRSRRPIRWGTSDLNPCRGTMPR